MVGQLMRLCEVKTSFSDLKAQLYINEKPESFLRRH